MVTFIKNNEFIVYQGSHRDRGAGIADANFYQALLIQSKMVYMKIWEEFKNVKKLHIPLVNLKRMENI